MDTKNNNTPSSKNPLVTSIIKHLGAYVILLLVSMLFFKPIAFDGKSLRQHDNVQALQMQKEILDYKAEENRIIRWTNSMFGGMPTAILRGDNTNYLGTYFSKGLSSIAKKEIRTLLLIMVLCYIGLILLNVPYALAIGLSILLAFFTSNSLFIEAGHTGKMDVLAVTPLLIAAFIYTYKKNRITGALIFTTGISYSIMRGHIQITYYTFFALGLIGLFYFIDALQQKKLLPFAKSSGAIIVATLLGLATNLGGFWSTYEYSQMSTRGKSELTKVNPSSAAPKESSKDASTGLPWDYVFGMSFEKMETATLMFPNFYGGTQAKSFYGDEGSKTKAAFSNPAIQQEIVNSAKKAGAKSDKDIQQFMGDIVGRYTRQYRGSQTICGGPMYFGVVVCFLLIFSLLLLRGPTKWAFSSILLFFAILSWGKHFEIFNDLMYYYFPFYSKFRDVKMVLLVAQPIVILIIGLGMLEFINFKSEEYKDTLSAKLLPKIKQTVSKSGYVILATAIGLGISLFLYLYIKLFGLSSPNDEILFQTSPKLLAAVLEDRANLAQTDIFKAVGFILATGAILFAYAKQKLPLSIATLLLIVLGCLDLNLVNKEYLNEDSYEKFSPSRKAQMVPTKADQDILKDKSIYRVVDYSTGRGPSQNAATSAFHKSMGGYFAAKPLLYQEVWNHYRMDYRDVALQKHSNLMNMFNVKYILLSPERIMDNPTALGNAWFVNKVNIVKNADEELQALDALNPTLEAVVQDEYSDYVKGLNDTYSPGDKIYLESYHPDTMTYQAEIGKDRFAVFSEMYTPKGWNVYIDGEGIDQKPIKTNYLLRGLKIPAGKHEIKMIYSPTSISVGKTISGGVSIGLWLIIIGLIVFYFINNNKKDND